MGSSRPTNPPGSHAAPDLAGHSRSTVVLIAEDEEPIAEAIAAVIEDAGYEAARVANGHEALEYTREHMPALVVTDMMMPRMDGLQLIAALRQDATLDGHAVPPVILMTAGSARRVREAHADAVLLKPFDIEQLEMLLGRFLSSAAR